jgi:hypothetical protein
MQIIVVKYGAFVLYEYSSIIVILEKSLISSPKKR